MDMDMDMSSDGSSCKVSMLWNWYTVDSCFLSESWHNRTKAQFAGTVIGIFLIVVATEGVRRIGREYDRRLIAAHKAAKATARCVDSHPSTTTGHSSPAVSPSLDKHGGIDSSTTSGYTLQPTCRAKTPALPTNIQQIFRAAIYGTQFTAAFLVMLFGMYYNGYVLFAIFLGGFVGNALFAADTVGSVGEMSKAESPCCC